MQRKIGQWAVGIALLAGAFSGAAAARADELVIARDTETIHVTALTPGVMRVRFCPAGLCPEDASWAVAHDLRAATTPATRTATTLATPLMRAVYDPAARLLHFEDAAGHTLFAEAPQPLARDGAGFTLRAALPADAHIYALGDKTGGLDRMGGSFVDWNSDAYGFSASTDPIYKSIPFFIATGGGADKRAAYGVFLDNNWRAWFDFGHREAGTLAIGSDGGAIDYYVIAGPTVGDVTRGYAGLTGHAPLPPRWALGYQQSRYSYMSEAEVRAIAARLRAERIPTDVLWLDIDYQDRNRPFTINSATFPHFGAMLHDLGAEGFKAVAIVDLHIADAPGQGYAPFDSGMAGDRFVHRADGSLYVAPVWPGPAVFPEFTQASTRAWWGGLYQPFLDLGVAGIWNDMNEPAIFETPSKTMPADVVHRIASDDFATRRAPHAEIHNVFGMENSRATFEGLSRLAPDTRPFVMTRASYAGGQRYAATWTGDNSATWDHLRLAIAQTLNLGLSGFAWTGTDVGGFGGGPSADLLTKWFEYGAFLPIFRDHSAKGTPRAEPWVDGPEHLAIRRAFVEARYRLMPYLYTLAEQNARTGDPLARPLFYDAAAAMAGAGCDATMHFTLGKALLIAGPPHPEQTAPYQACLPPNNNQRGGWYDYWTGAAVNAAPTITPRLDTLPVFVRAGSIIPRAPLTQSTSAPPSGNLELVIYPGAAGADCAGELYDDDGASLGYRRGDFLRQHASCTSDAIGLTSLTLAPREGRYRPWWRGITLTIAGPGHYRATLAGQPLAAGPTPGSFLAPDLPRGGTIRFIAQ